VLASRTMIHTHIQRERQTDVSLRQPLSLQSLTLEEDEDVDGGRPTEKRRDGNVNKGWKTGSGALTPTNPPTQCDKLSNAINENS